MPENEITSAQVMFPDNRTLDEVYEDIINKISNLQTGITALQKEIEALKET